MAESTENTSEELMYLDVAEAARRMGVAEDVVRRYCRDGHLPGVEKDSRGCWHIPETAIKAWLHQNTTSSAPTPVPPDVPKHRWTFYLGIALPLLIAVIVIAGFSLGWKSPKELWREWDPLLTVVKPASEGGVLILIADFDVAKGAIDTDVDSEIYREIANASESLGLSDFRVERHALNLEMNDREGAEALGQRYGARMVIWGSDTGSRITVNYLNLVDSDFDPATPISDIKYSGLATPSTYCFCTLSQDDLSTQLPYLSFFGIGQSYISVMDYTNALQAIKRASDSIVESSVPDNSEEVYFQLGWLYQTTGNSAQAITAYTKALQLEPNYASAYLNRGIAYSSQGNNDQALQDCDSTIHLQANSAMAYYQCGYIYFLQNDYEQAIQYFSEAIQLEPDFAKAYFYRGSVLGEQAQYDGAILDYTRVIELDPTHAYSYFFRGVTYYIQGEYDKAIQDYTETICLEPDYVEAYYNRGLAHGDQGEYELAIQDCDEAIRLEPGYAAAFHNRAFYQGMLENYEQAIQDYTEAIRLMPEDATGYFNRSVMYLALGDSESAIRDSTEAIHLDYKYVAAYLNRGVAYAYQGDLEQAVDDYSKAIRLDPDFSLAYYYRSLAYAALGEDGLAAADQAEYERLDGAD